MNVSNNTQDAMAAFYSAHDPASCVIISDNTKRLKYEKVCNASLCL